MISNGSIIFETMLFGPKKNLLSRPDLTRDEIEALQERAATVTHFEGPELSDRPLRDLTALGFFSAAKTILLDPNGRTL